MEKLEPMFRLKLTYQAENSETGDIEKVKDEILAECINYTAAEMLVNKLIENYSMNKYSEAVYEIVKCKFGVSDIYCNELVKCDSSDVPLTTGLLACFFEDEISSLYAVDTVIFGNKEEKEKDTKATYLIPAKDPADATQRARAILHYDDKHKDDYAIVNVKYDKAGTLYLQPYSFNHSTERTEKIQAEYGL